MPAGKSVRPASSSSPRLRPKIAPRQRRPASRGSRGSRHRIASPVAGMPRRVCASSSRNRGRFGQKCREKKNGRPSWTPLESITSVSPSLSRSWDTSRRCRAARDVPPHGARARVRRPCADSASVLPFGKTPASMPAPARVSAVCRNVPLRSLAAGAASARGGMKPSAGRFCLLVFGRFSSRRARIFFVSGCLN